MKNDWKMMKFLKNDENKNDEKTLKMMKNEAKS